MLIESYNKFRLRNEFAIEDIEALISLLVEDYTILNTTAKSDLVIVGDITDLEFLDNYGKSEKLLFWLDNKYNYSNLLGHYNYKKNSLYYKLYMEIKKRLTGYDLDKKEIELFINTNKDFSSLIRVINMIENNTEYVNGVIKNLTSQMWEIKSKIEHYKVLA